MRMLPSAVVLAGVVGLVAGETLVWQHDNDFATASNWLNGGVRDWASLQFPREQAAFNQKAGAAYSITQDYNLGSMILPGNGQFLMGDNVKLVFDEPETGVSVPSQYGV